MTLVIPCFGQLSLTQHEKTTNRIWVTYKYKLIIGWSMNIKDKYFLADC